MKPIFLIILITISLLSVSAQAEDTDSGDYIISGCEAVAGLRKANDWDTRSREWMCFGAITAVSFEALANGYLCAPEGVTKGQEARVVSKDMENHPENLSQPYTVLIYNALVQAWPCKMKK